MARKLTYHNHGPATGCGVTCPYFSSPEGTWLDFHVKFRAAGFVPQVLDSTKLAKAVAAEIVRQTGAIVSSGDFESMDLRVVPPPLRVGHVTAESLEAYTHNG